MEMATFLRYIFLMLPQPGCHHPWHHEPCHQDSDSAAHWIHREYSFQLLRLKCTMHPEMSLMIYDLSETSPELCDHPKYYSSSERGRGKRKAWNLFSKTVGSSHCLLHRPGMVSCRCSASFANISFPNGSNILTSTGSKTCSIPDGQFSWWAACCIQLIMSHRAVRNLLR